MQTTVPIRHEDEQLREAKLYLTELEALAEEINRAVAAIAGRSLLEFEDSLGRQIAVCARLAEHAGRPIRSRDQEPGQETDLDEELATRIKTTTAHLAALNRQYSTLVKHFSDTARLFAGLFRPYSRDGRDEGGMRPHLHTWSCDL